MPTDHILDRPDDWTQTFWGKAGIQLASTVPYRLAAGKGRLAPWNILVMEAINGFELGCAISLGDMSVGKSILERDCTVTSPYSEEVLEDWESVYSPIIQDLNRRISACGDNGHSYRNMFPESGPDLTVDAASKVIARQVFRGLLLPFIDKTAAEHILEGSLKSRMEEPMRGPSWIRSEDDPPDEDTPIPVLLTLAKQRAVSAYEHWVDTGAIPWPETNNSDTSDYSVPESNPNQQPYYAIVVLWSYAQGCDPCGVDDWCDEYWYATKEEAIKAVEALEMRVTDPGYGGRRFAALNLEFRDWGESYAPIRW